MTEDTRIRREAYRRSEERIASQLAAGLAADQRAMSAGGLAMAAAAILCGFAASAPVPLALLIGAAFVAAAAFLAWYSARPAPFFMPGAFYSAYQTAIEDETPEGDLLDHTGAQNDASARSNDKALKANSRLMKIAYLLALIGMVGAILPQAISVAFL